jgi:beta-fructofuranosidase
MTADPRPRPRLHFTPRTGWLNDPHGIVHTGGRYHLFFQYNPASTTWAAAISWGHATSADLVTWTEEPVALTPEAGETGCWSGDVVLSDRGVPTLFYTSVPAGGDLRRGRIVRAVGEPSMTGWRRDAVPVIEELPGDVVELRDPYVWRAADSWRMIIGAGRPGAGAIVQYSSDDLRDWSYDGIAAERPQSETGGRATGSMWECPQLFPLDGTWVLLVSPLADGRPAGVAYALGDYDGKRFTPHVWGDFGHGDVMYASTSFVDAEGRRCVMSWLRETHDVTGSPWAGAMSLPWVLRVRGDLLVASPHPNLAAHLDPASTVVTDADIVESIRDGVSGVAVARTPWRAR